ncbi:hypothetical protein BS78_10G151000 [Paspalum vaginatum]|nr:hypothetical protein BS78_10G151000 [Paspalum vaginatum]
MPWPAMHQHIPRRRHERCSSLHVSIVLHHLWNKQADSRRGTHLKEHVPTLLLSYTPPPASSPAPETLSTFTAAVAPPETPSTFAAADRLPPETLTHLLFLLCASSTSTACRSCCTSSSLLRHVIFAVTFRW